MAEAAVGAPAIHEVHEAELSGVSGSGEARHQRDGAALCPRGLAQGLQHLVLAPRVLQEAWGDEQHAAVTATQCLAQLGHDGAAWGRIPKLQEAAQAGSAALQVGDQLLGGRQVLLTVAHTDIVVLAPAATPAAAAATTHVCGWGGGRQG